MELLNSSIKFQGQLTPSTDYFKVEPEVESQIFLATVALTIYPHLFACLSFPPLITSGGIFQWFFTPVPWYQLRTFSLHYNT